MKKTILFIDNKPEWLDVYSRLLEQAGYDVVRAGTLEEAQKALREKRIHLGIFDIRMEDDGDQNDISGLLLAQSEDYRPLPKIILTAYGTVEYVRRALGTGSDGFPAAVNFVGKEEAHEMLIEAVKQAFERHVRINWNLVIQVNEHVAVTFHHLATLVAPGLEGELLRSRSGELEDLFRRLCFGAAKDAWPWRWSRSPTAKRPSHSCLCAERTPPYGTRLAPTGNSDLRRRARPGPF